jgi:protein O-GlcNAc transferase
MINYLFAKYALKFIREPDKKWEFKTKYPKLLFLPHMELKEYLLFKDLCKNKKVFIEYGSGGSTIHLLKSGKKVFSVESNGEFHDMMNSISLVQKAKGQLLHPVHIDLGPCDMWGKPLTSEKECAWSRYYSEVWDEVKRHQSRVDVVFIDGRFRVCCCLYSILKVVEYGWKDTLFLVHDFWRRKHYHVVLKFLNEYKSRLDLASFRVKDNIDKDEVKWLLQQYAQATG